jgi:uncharacterized protein
MLAGASNPSPGWEKGRDEGMTPGGVSHGGAAAYRSAHMRGGGTLLQFPAAGPLPCPSPAREKGSCRAMVRPLSQNRLHLQDGPIDLILQAQGKERAVAAAYRAAIDRFGSVLDELCSELPLLRRAADPDHPPAGLVAQRMWRAVLPYAPHGFITPMAAVAGSVAEEILAAMTAAADLTMAYVNNGGDIALHLADQRSTTIGLIDRQDRPSLFGKAVIHASDPVRGVATSGWHGRSFSLGIADAVTILARSASLADAAATVIANAVDLPSHEGIVRVPARDIQPDSDLGARCVTRCVPPLAEQEKSAALARGAAIAEALLAEQCIHGAALHLQGMTRLVVAGD